MRNPMYLTWILIVLKNKINWCNYVENMSNMHYSKLWFVRHTDNMTYSHAGCMLLSYHFSVNFWKFSTQPRRFSKFTDKNGWCDVCVNSAELHEPNGTLLWEQVALDESKVVLFLFIYLVMHCLRFDTTTQLALEWNRNLRMLESQHL